MTVCQGCDVEARTKSYTTHGKETRLCSLCASTILGNYAIHGGVPSNYDLMRFIAQVAWWLRRGK